jgi:hypothetical protein
MPELSELYKACRDGNILRVQNLLSSLSLDDVNLIEPNGSTALHAASYYGHKDIVKLLLEKGARRHQLNAYHLSPADEASTPEIKQLFKRPLTEKNQRFGSDTPHLEWMKSAFDVREISLVNIMHTSPFPSLDEALKQICSAKELQDAQGMEQIRSLLDDACKKNDASYLLRAYTANTDFYRRLNHLYAQLPFRRYTNEDRARWYVQFAATVDSSEQYSKYGWKGVSYRGMMITQADLDQYRIGDWIVNKAFLSTSKNPEVAEVFISEPVANKLALLTKYYTTRDRTH